MTHAAFVHLVVHTAYSLSEGAIKIKPLAELCRAERMPAVAMTDTNNLFGALEFSKEIAAAGVQPIIGCRLSVSRPEAPSQAFGAGKTVRKPDPDALILLAQNETGWANLMRLSSAAYLDTAPTDVPQVPWSLVERHSEGLLCLTAGPEGAVGRLLLDGQVEAAQAEFTRLMAAFPDRLYVELRRHGLAAEQRIEGGLLTLAYDNDVPLVATNDSYFGSTAMFEAHDALLCIADGRYVGESDRRRVSPEHRFKGAAEMRKLFDDLPEACDNTLVVAQRCAFMAPERKPILPRFTTEDPNETEEQALRRMATDGLKERIGQHAIPADRVPEYEQRLAFELDVIVKMGFPGYFLIVADFIQWSKAHDIPVGPGRGSGAGSVVAWALTITDLDPLRFSLLFERFLNPERVSMPDFDIDFCQDKRDQVIRYVQDKYGRDQVAQIITFGKLQARAALRDVGRVLQMPLGHVDRLAKMVPNNPAKPVTLKEAIAGEPRLQEERDRDENVARLLDVALRLEGLYRNASTHAAGVVIGDRPLVELVPLYRDPGSEIPATQFSMKYVEAAGLVKFDFLGLKTLTVLDKAVKLIHRRQPIDLKTLPLEDKDTFDLMSRGETVGIFQLESAGMRDALRLMRPDKFEDIIALVALYRPGPMDNIPRYCNCKHGTEQPDYLHPWLEPVLKETYGVIVYQEQVMEIAKILAGYSLGEADLLRRAMGKKIKAEMDAQRGRFVEGAVAKGVDKDKASEIFDLLAKFADYGFNKSHAAAYALVAWQTAYLKTKFPVEFMAASMTLDLSNTDKLGVFRQDCQRMGITIQQPDINRSEVEFGVADGAILYALAAIRNVGAGAMETVVAERRANGPFRSLFDFAGRLDSQAVNKRMVENLARAGAFDSLEPARHRSHAAAETLIRHAQRSREEKQSAQVSLFGGPAESSAPPPPLPDVDPWTDLERLNHEFEAVGFYLSAHPLDGYARLLERARVVRYAQMLPQINLSMQRFMIAGTVLAKQERTGKTGNRFAFVHCSDPSGMFEITVFSELLATHRDLLEPGQSLIFTVDAQLRDDVPRLMVSKIENLDRAAERAGGGLRLYLNDPAPIDTMKQVLGRVPQGKGQVYVRLRLEDGAREADIRLPGGYALNPQVRSALRAVRGVTDVVDI